MDICGLSRARPPIDGGYIAPDKAEVSGSQPQESNTSGIWPAMWQIEPLTGGSLTASLFASDTSIETALQLVKLFQCIDKRGCYVGRRFAVRPLGLEAAGHQTPHFAGSV